MGKIFLWADSFPVIRAKNVDLSNSCAILVAEVILVANNCKMKAEAIIFDKDGTLLDFDAFWLPVSRKALPKVLAQLELDTGLLDEVLEGIGVHSGVTQISGVLCYGTYGQIAHGVYQVLKRHGCTASEDTVAQLVENAYEESVDAGELQPTCANLREVLTVLKQRGKKLAVITTDNEEVAAFCLKHLGIDDLFDKIYADGGPFPAKPSPESAWDFCAFAGAEKDRVIMVGDSLTDIAFARNAGIPVISVAKTEENRNILRPEADLLLHDVSGLLDAVE